MPFTPFHFGPGMLAKAIAPRWFSWTAFAATQVVIDTETLILLTRGEPPFHRTLHTLVGGTLAGAATAAAMIGARALARRVAPRMVEALERRGPAVRAETASAPILFGALLGGASHALLDGVMHDDTLPFEPWLTTNPLLGAASVMTLQLACIVTGVIGLLVIETIVSRQMAAARERGQAARSSRD